jgi:TP901 family phage tail tape measure protein
MAEGEIRVPIIPVPDKGATEAAKREFTKAFSSARFSIGALETSKFTQPLGRIRGELGEFEKSLAASNARVVAFGASAGAIFAISSALKETVRSAIQVEKTFTEIAAVMGRSVSSMTSFSNQLFDAANAFGQSFESASKGALELARQGLGTTETIKRLSAALLLARQSGQSVEESVTTVTAALNSFTGQAIDAIRLVNQLAAVDQKFAVSSADISEALKRVGSTASDAGVSIEQLIALITAAQQTTQRGGAVIGNALKSIFTRLERPKVLEQLQGVGVSIKNLDGSVRPLIGILGDLAGNFDRLTSAQQSHVAELVGGVYQVNILKAALRDLSKDYSFYSQALNTANTATDEAIRRNEELNKSLSSQLQRTFNNLTKAGAGFGQLAIVPAIKKLLNSGEALAENGDFGAGIGKALVAGIGKSLAGPGISAFTLIFLQLGKKLASFVSDALKQVSGLDASRRNQLEIEKGIFDLLLKQKDLFKGLKDGSLNELNLREAIVSALEKENALLERAAALSKSASTGLGLAGYRVQNERLTAPGKTASGGYAPDMMERFGALAGGYKPGAIKHMMLDGKNITYNNAEKVVPYGKSAFIIPPQGSPAREKYDAKLRDRGIDPHTFAYDGVIPNLARTKEDILAEAAQLAKEGKFVHKNVLRSAIREQTFTFEEAQALNPELKQEGELAAKAAAKAERDKTFRTVDGRNLASMLVYNGASGSSGYGFEGERVRVLFNVSALDKSKLRGPSDLQGDVTKFLSDSTLKFAQQVGPPISSQQAKPFLDKAIAESKGNIFSIVGDIFEHGFGAAFQGAIQRSPSIGSSNFDIGNISPRLREFFPGVSANLGDFKVEASEDARESMANKILIYKGFGKGLRNAKGGAPSKESVLKHVAGNFGPGLANFALGEIPSLAPVSDAIQREMRAGYSRSQVKIGYDNRVGPLVYNTTEGSAKNAVNIHRRMGKSISQIKKAGLAFSGKIPNLAADDEGAGLDIGLGVGLFASQLALSQSGSLHQKEIQEIEKKIQAHHKELDSIEANAVNAGKIKEKNDEISKLTTQRAHLEELGNQDSSRRNRLLATAFIAPVIGGFAENGLQNSAPALAKSVSGLSDALSTGAQIAFAIPGHIGLVVGSLSAVAVGAGKLYHAIADKAPELERALAKERESFETTSNSVSTFSQAFDKLNDAYSNQASTAENITKLQQQYAIALADVPDEYRELVSSAGSAADAQRSVAENLQKQAAKISQLELASSLAKKIDNSRGIFADTSIFDLKTEAGGRQLKTFAARTVSTADKPQEFASRVANTNINSAKDFNDLVAAARAAGEIGSDLAETLQRLGKEAQGLQGFFDNATGSLNAFAKSLRETATATRDAVANLEITKAIRKSQSLIDAQLKQSADSTKESISALSDSIKGLAGQGLLFANTRASLGNQNRANLGNTQISALESALSKFGSNLGDSIRGGIEDSLSLVKTELEGANRFRQTDTEAVNNLFGSIQGALEELISKAGGVEGGTPRNPFQEQEATQALQQLGQLRGTVNTPEDASKALLSFISRNNDVLGDKFEVLINKNDQIVRELVSTKAQLDQDIREQIKLALINNEINQASRLAVERGRRLGGAEGFLNPKAFGDALQKVAKGTFTLSNPNGELLKGRGAFDLLSGLKELLGNDIGGPRLDNLREIAIKGRTREIQNTGSVIAGQLEASGFGASAGSFERAGLFGAAKEVRRATTGPEAAATARQQIESAIPLRRMPEDIAKQVDLLRAILGTLNGDITSALQEGAEASKTIRTFTPSAISDEISKKQSQIGKLEDREKEIRGAQEIVSKTSALINEVLVNNKNDEGLRASLQDLFGRGDIINSLKIVQSRGTAPEKTRASQILKQIGDSGAQAKIRLLNTSVGYESKTAFAVTRLLALGSTVGSIFTHDHSVVGAIESLPDALADVLRERGIATGGTGVNISPGILSSLGKTLQAAVTAGLATGLIALLGTRGGRAGAAASVRFAGSSIRSAFGRGGAPNFQSLLEEERLLQELKPTITNLARAIPKVSFGGSSTFNRPPFVPNRVSLATEFPRVASALDTTRSAFNTTRSAIGRGLGVGPTVEDLGANVGPAFRRTGSALGRFGRGTALFGGAVGDEARELVKPFVNFGRGSIGAIVGATKEIAGGGLEALGTDLGVGVFRQHSRDIKAYQAAQRANQAAQRANQALSAAQQVTRQSFNLGIGQPTEITPGYSVSLFRNPANASTSAGKNLAKGIKLGTASEASTYQTLRTPGEGFGRPHFVTRNINEALASRSQGTLARFLQSRTGSLLRGGAGIGAGFLFSLPFSIASGRLEDEAISGKRSKASSVGRGAAAYGLNILSGIAGGGVGGLVAGTGIGIGARFGGVAAAASYPAYLGLRISQENLAYQRGRGAAFSGPSRRLQNIRGQLSDNLLQQITKSSIGKEDKTLFTNRVKQGEQARRAIELIGEYRAAQSGGEKDTADSFLSQLRPTVARALGVDVKEARRLVGGYTRNLPGNDLYQRLVKTQNSGRFSQVISEANQKLTPSYNDFGARAKAERAPAVAALKVNYGIAPEQLQNLKSRNGNTFGALNQAAFIHLSREAAANKEGLGGDFEKSGKLDLLNELGQNYFSANFSANKYLSAGRLDLKKLYNGDEGKDFIKSYTQNIKSIAATGEHPGANIAAYQNLTNVGGYTYPGQDIYGQRQTAYDKANPKVFVNGQATYADQSSQALFLRSLPKDTRDQYLGQAETTQDLFTKSLPPEVAYRTEQARYRQLGAAGINTASQATAPQPPSPGEQLGQIVKDALGGEFAKGVGESIASAIKSNQDQNNANGNLQINWPKLEVSVSGDVTVDGKQVTPDNNIVTKITNAIYRALGRADLVKPLQQTGGQTDGG